MSKIFDVRKYGALLMTALPQVIESDEELDRVEQIVDRLLSKGENISPEEEKLLDLVSDLIEKYESERFSFPAVSPNEIIQFLMEQNNLKQSDLLSVFGSSGIASEVINGKRSISKAQAKKLAEFFNVSVELFI